jgi:16S rRNA processing protein RimM
MADRSDLILVGHVTGAFGVNGEVKLRAYTAETRGIVSYGPLLDERGAVVLTPLRARAIKDGLAVTASEIGTREQAEALKGARLFVPRDRLPAPADADEYYVVDLIGCAVEDLQGRPLGSIVAIHDFGAGDILEIRDHARTWYLPFTAENAPRVEIAARRVVADPPADLLPPDPPPPA